MASCLNPLSHDCYEDTGGGSGRTMYAALCSLEEECDTNVFNQNTYYYCLCVLLYANKLKQIGLYVYIHCRGGEDLNRISTGSECDPIPKQFCPSHLFRHTISTCVLSGSLRVTRPTNLLQVKWIKANLHEWNLKSSTLGVA